MQLRVGQRVESTEAEGPGTRFALWTQGCTLRCPGCCNPHLFADRGGALQRKHHVLFTRLRDRLTNYTRWVHDLALPFDNYAGEHRIRMPKPGSSVRPRGYGP